MRRASYKPVKRIVRIMEIVDWNRVDLGTHIVLMDGDKIIGRFGHDWEAARKARKAHIKTVMEAL